MNNQNRNKEPSKKSQSSFHRANGATHGVVPAVLTALSAMMFLYSQSVISGPKPEQFQAEARVDLERVALRSALSVTTDPAERSRLSRELTDSTLASGRRISVILHGLTWRWDSSFAGSELDFRPDRFSFDAEPVFVDLSRTVQSAPQPFLFDFVRVRDYALIDLRYENTTVAQEFSQKIRHESVQLLAIGPLGLYEIPKSTFASGVNAEAVESAKWQVLHSHFFSTDLRTATGASDQKYEFLDARLSVRVNERSLLLQAQHAAEALHRVFPDGHSLNVGEDLKAVWDSIQREPSLRAAANEFSDHQRTFQVLDALARAGYSVVFRGKQGWGSTQRFLVELVRRGAH